MEVNNKLLFGFIEEASLQVGPEVISPTEAAALAAAAKTSELRDSAPAALAVCEHEVHQFLVLLGCPWTFLHTKLVTTRLPAHHFVLVPCLASHQSLQLQESLSPTHPPLYTGE